MLRAGLAGSRLLADTGPLPGDLTARRDEPIDGKQLPTLPRRWQNKDGLAVSFPLRGLWYRVLSCPLGLHRNGPLFCGKMKMSRHQGSVTAGAGLKQGSGAGGEEEEEGAVMREHLFTPSVAPFKVFRDLTHRWWGRAVKVE
ncbi:unnamed protein product [Merluccius merluccius]